MYPQRVRVHLQQISRLGGSPETRITAENRLTTYRAARSAFSAVGLDTTGPCRESGKTGLDWRELVHTEAVLFRWMVRGRFGVDAGRFSSPSRMSLLLRPGLSTRPSRNITSVFPSGLAPDGKTEGTAAQPRLRRLQAKEHALRQCGNDASDRPHHVPAPARWLRASVPASYGSAISRRQLACRAAGGLPRFACPPSFGRRETAIRTRV